MQKAGQDDFVAKGFWDRAESMGQAANKADWAEDPLYAAIRNNPQSQQALRRAGLDATRPDVNSTYRQWASEPAEEVFDEIDLSEDTRGGLTYAAKKAQDLARRFRSNRPSTEF
jgi:hypothetical protein